jgi:peroxiredoxin Q/BCP
VGREVARRGRHTRRRGLLAQLLPVRRTTFVIDTDRTVLKVVSSEVRASVHADETLRFLENHVVSRSSSPVREKHTDTHQHSDGRREPIGDWLTAPVITDDPNLVRPYTLAAGRTDADVNLPLDAPVEALDTAAKPSRWRKNDARSQILTSCVHSPSVAELDSRLSLPIGATRFLVDDLVTQG